MTAGAAEPEAEAAKNGRDHVLRLLAGKWLAATVAAAAELGLPAALAEAPLPGDTLADRLGCDPRALERLLRVLHGVELVAVDEGRRYALTAAGRCLTDDALGPLARHVGASFNWGPWSGLAEGIRTGRAPFEAFHGRPLFDHLDATPPDAETYHAAIDAFVREEADEIAEHYDFSDARRVVDLGGGRGALLARLLARWPHLEGELVERPAVAEDARATLAAAGVAARSRVHAGDFDDALPRDVDVFLLKHVVHCLEDGAARALLARCRAALAPGGVVLIIEGLRLPAGHLDQTGLLDLEMFVLFGAAGERSKPEMRRLLADAGLRFVRSPALSGGARLIVAAAAA